MSKEKPITEAGPSNVDGTKPLPEKTEITQEQCASKPLKALKQTDVASSNVSVFLNTTAFDSAQRMAKMLCASSLVPKEYQGQDGLPNAVIALEMAQRIGASPLAVMQNLYIVHGKPGWSAQFIIASLNSCGRYSPLRFSLIRDDKGVAQSCVASAIELATGELLEGPPITLEIAFLEGWSTKNGSKWKTMPELMLRYRAASFFGKLYAPDILMGMQSADELGDIIEGVKNDGATSADDLNAAIGGEHE